MSIAFVLDGPTIEEQLLPSAVYFSALAILISWLLIRWNRRLVFIAAAMALAAGCAVVDLPATTKGWLNAAVAIYHDPLDRALWFAALLPSIMTGLFYLAGNKKPNKSPEPTPTAVTPRAK